MNRRQAKKAQKKNLINMRFKLKLICILDDLDREVALEFFMPKIFNTYKSAEKANCSYYVKPAKLASGEVVFEIYKKGQSTYGKHPERIDIVVDTVRWEEYWKYQSTILKNDISTKTLSDVFPNKNLDELGEFVDFPCAEYFDYELYLDKFEEMYKKYLTHKSFDEVRQYALQCIAYGVVPILL